MITSKELKNIKYAIIQKLYQILGCFVDWKDWQGRNYFQTMQCIILFFKADMYSARIKLFSFSSSIFMAVAINF